MTLIALWILRSGKMPEIIDNLQNRYPRVNNFNKDRKIKRARKEFKMVALIDKIRSGENKNLMLEI